MMIDGYIPTILIVDDKATNIAILSDLLKDDYKIKVANSGQRALSLVREKEKPDLILLDIEMPQMSGYDVCKTLKSSAETIDIPIIFVTAKNSSEDEEYGLNLGAIDYIKKPFHSGIIKIRIKNHLTLKLKSKKLEELSMCDSLTGISNRRYFDEILEQKYREIIREPKNIAILMVDIDYFKLYNDNYGHWMGDECLTKVALALKKAIKRPTDVLARYGGEEFVVLLKGVDKDGAKQVAQSLIDSISNLNLAHNFSPVSKIVTICVGVAIKEVDEDISKEDLIKKADAELYRAKNSGRNKFCAGF
ncbi:MAG: diguanylate cyclase [Sulfurimonas denitrificans]|nr:diguanylate cyclase [Sulfurimonas denitrificans]